MALAVSRGEGGGAGGEDNHDEVANTVVFQPRIQQVFGPGARLCVEEGENSTDPHRSHQYARLRDGLNNR